MKSFSLSLFGIAVLACSDKTARVEVSNKDSAFATVQERGKAVMGVDQYTSKHVFEDLPDGGRVVLEMKDVADTAEIAIIRAHMQEILKDFRSGNFTKPFQVHAMDVPGTDVMRTGAARINYSVVDRPRGAELRMATTDSTVLAAIRKFLEFQRSDHRASGHDM